MSFLAEPLLMGFGESRAYGITGGMVQAGLSPVGYCYWSFSPEWLTLPFASPKPGVPWPLWFLALTLKARKPPSKGPSSASPTCAMAAQPTSSASRRSMALRPPAWFWSLTR